jgi:AraC-like DNA-binding protein
MRPSISVVLLRPVFAALAGVPGGIERLRAATDVGPEHLADADARVTPAQFCVAWAELVRLTGDPQVALRIADATPPGAFGVVEYVCRCAPTLGDALRHWVRYLNLLDDAVVVGLVEEGAHACLRVLAESEAPAPASHELCFALVCRHARQIAGAPFRPVAVEFGHRASGDVGAYGRWFEAPVRFGAESTQLVLPRAALGTPLVTADPALLAVLTRHAEALRAEDPDGQPTTAEVRRVLRAALRGDAADVDLVAARLGLTSRSLQRRLKDEGTSFQAVRDEVRRDLATRYLEERLSVAEISFLLGFSEPSAFFRAFKRWTGRTPLEWRPRPA